jgi:hypothetical protein
VEQAIAGPVSLAPDAVELLQQAREGFEVLEPLPFVLLDFVPLLMHARQVKYLQHSWRLVM